MTTFLTALIAVGVLLLTAAPGFILIRRRMIDEACIPGLSKILLYVCQPCLFVYSLKSTAFSAEKLAHMGIFALLVLVLHAVMLGGVFLLLRKRGRTDVFCRIATVASAFGNCAFFGIPIIEALMPDIASELIVYTAVYAFVMNVLGWTVGSAVISGNPGYIKLKKVILNPATIGAAVAMFLFCLQIPLPADLFSMVTTVGRMSSAVSMLIMGMRLGTMNLGRIFLRIRTYPVIFVKQCVMPAVAFALVFFLPLDMHVKRTFFITSACPVASIVLNFSEILGEGQDDAASLVLLGTMLSTVTLPFMSLLLPFLQ